MNQVTDAIMAIIRAHAPVDSDCEAITRRLRRGLDLTVIEEAASAGIPNNIQDQAFKNLYAAHYMKLISNLDPANGAHLLNLIFDNKIEPVKVAAMTSAEMNPSANAHIREELDIRLQQKVELKHSTAYRCSKCKEKRTTYYETQNRAADEQSTINLKCLKCGHTWRR